MYYVAAGCVGRMFCNRNYPDRLYSGFSDEPYSYSYFRMSALHYLHYCAISCILIPGLTVLWKKIDSEESKWRNGAIIIANIVAFAVPFLYVSRFQFLFEIGVAAVIYILVK